ncbi:carboxypeptidase regulatory-like domain-containing protein [Clostridium sp. HCP1S3_B4]|uniref:carboxypeptidase-like regulatory domain-containing protein n=1 Tax=unclassified Clostridium TaxID=2614128 RepID=UPI003F8BE4CC|nr:carboxypeptidase regulatory-like domain-containing protein [Clostridiales bacterium]
MSGKVAVCSVCPKKNQQIEAVIKLPEERRAVIHGTVLDANGNPVADAVVKLLQIVDCCKLPVPLTHTFTDQYGQFLLGPLCPDKKYMLKVYKDNIDMKYMPLDVSCYEGKCIGIKSKKNNCECEKEDKFDSCRCGKY